jgi:hypothetical protein
MNWTVRAQACCIAALAPLLASCGVMTPSDIQPSVANGVTVATQFKADAHFGSYRTFAIVNQVAVTTVGSWVGPSPAPQAAALGPAVLNRVVANLVARGYQQVPLGQPADLSVNVTVIFAVNSYAPGSWLGLPGYYPTGVWGFPGYGWSYPWAWWPTYYNTSMLLVDLGDLKNAPPPGPNQLPIEIVWSAMNYGVISGQVFPDLARFLNAIDQSFSQSPYLHTP